MEGSVNSFGYGQGPERAQGDRDGTRPGKRIAIVLPNLGGGGVERVRIELARQFIEQGYRVDFVLLKRTGELLSEIPPEAEIVELNARSFKQSLLPLRQYISLEKPDALLAGMWPLTAITFLAAKLARSSARIVLSEHAHLSKSVDHGPASKLLMRIIGRGVYTSADGAVCVSDGVRQDLCATLGLEPEQFAIIHNPVRQSWKEAKVPDELLAWWKEADYQLLAAGRLTAQKDFENLLHALSVLKERLKVRLVILGEGPERGPLEGLRTTLGLDDDVQLPGFVQNVQPYLGQASLFVLSSRWEGLGNVITEALGQGVPVVSTDCPSGPAELLDGGRYGRLVPVGEPRMLAEAMSSSLTDSHDHAALRDRGRQFDPEKVAAEYLRLLDPDYRAASRLLKRK